MNTLIRCLLISPAVFAALSCEHRMPVAPSPRPASSTPQPSEEQQAPSRRSPVEPERFEISGGVTDDRGAPLAGANVTMATTASFPNWPSALTDVSGRYRLIFSANTLQWPGGRFVARAEVVAPGHEVYWRNLVATTGSTLNESFRLQRIQRVVAGRSLVVSFVSDMGDCPGWVAPVCGTVRITAPTPANVTVDVIGTAGQRPTLEMCCVSGNEVYGNPVTVPADGRTELEVRIELASGAQKSFEVKTSIEPSM